MKIFDLRQELKAGQAGHPLVAENEGKGSAAGDFERALGISGFGHFVTMEAQGRAENV